MARPLFRLCFVLVLTTVPAATPGIVHAQRANAWSYGASYEPPADLFARDALTQVESAKSPGTSALISFLITGGGQVYNEEYTKGAIMFGLGVLFAVMAIDGIDEYDCDPSEDCAPWLLPTGLIGGLGVKVWSIFDAAAGAKRWNRSHNVGALDVPPAFGLVRLPSGDVGVTVVRSSF